MQSRTILLLLVVLPTALSASICHAQTERDTLNQAAIEPRIGQSMPLDVTLKDHRGEPISLDRIIDGRRPTIVSLVYFDCPMLCKLSADGLVRATASIEADVGDIYDVAVISFDPRDTPDRASAARREALRKYARGEAGDGWYFLTGDQASIDKITNAVGFRYVWDDETKQFAHASGLVVIASDGTITEYLDGVRFSPGEL